MYIEDKCVEQQCLCAWCVCVRVCVHVNYDTMLKAVSDINMAVYYTFVVNPYIMYINLPTVKTYKQNKTKKVIDYV